MMRSIRQLGYVCQRGLDQMVQAPSVQVLAILSIALCTSLLTFVLWAWSSASHIARSWGVDVPVTVYFDDDIDEGRAGKLVERLQRVGPVTRIDIVSPEQAAARVEASLGEGTKTPELLADLFPFSLEIRLRDDVPDDFAGALAARIRNEPGVEDAVATGDWARRANELLDLLERAIALTGVLVAIACMTIVGSTIRLGVYARRAEVEILRLVGGTAAFVRGPYLVEGFLQGTCGATLGVCFVGCIHRAAGHVLGDGNDTGLVADHLTFLTQPQVVAIVVLGALVGLLASRAAVARYAEI